MSVLRVQRSGFRVAACLFAMGCGGCATSNPEIPKTPEIDPVLVQLSSSGRGAFDRGALAQASLFYEQALQRARATDRGPDVAAASHNLAACRLAQGRPAEAAVLLREAVAEQARAGLPTSDALLLQARAAQAEGRVDEAGVLVERVLVQKPGPRPTAEALLLKGEWALAAGDAAGAAAALAEAEKGIRKAPSLPLEAGARALSARLALQRGEPAAAAAEFDREADAWRSAQRTRDLALALERSAQAWTQAGDAGEAAERWYRAGRSFFAQGDALRALGTVESAVKACETVGNDDLSERVAALFVEITAAVERSKQTAAR